jgi:vancomycin permeability regulator SanA
LNATRRPRPTPSRKIPRRPAHRVAPKRRHRVGWLGRTILAGVAVVLVLLAWAAIDRVLAPKANTPQQRFDAIIVLGYPADAEGNPTPVQLSRVTEGVNEYERGVAPRIIFTGGAAHNKFVESQVMARTAEAQGIPPRPSSRTRMR